MTTLFAMLPVYKPDAYDSLNRLKTATEKAGATTTASWAYSYDAAGNRTQQVRAGSTGEAAGTINYTYNAANQITSATGSTSAWTYDSAGNQTQKGLGVAGEVGQNMSYNGRGAVTLIGATTMTSWGQGNSRTLTRTTSTPTRTFYLNSPTGLMAASSGGVRAYTRTPDGAIVGARYYSLSPPHFFWSCRLFRNLTTKLRRSCYFRLPKLSPRRSRGLVLDEVETLA